MVKSYRSHFISERANKRMINRNCTFGNKAQLQAPTAEDMPTEVKVRGKDESMTAMLKDVPWILRIPCPLLSTEMILRNGGELLESGSEQSYLRVDTKRPKIMLKERNGFITLEDFLQARVK